MMGIFGRGSRRSTTTMMAAAFSTGATAARGGPRGARSAFFSSSMSQRSLVFFPSSLSLQQQQLHSSSSPSTTTRLSMSTLAPERKSTSTLELEKAYATTHPSYDVLQQDVVTEYGAYCTLYRHKKSGAELLSVSCDDDNKVFCVTLRTPPNDNTGVPHILEHSVLCGSRKYKTKDPFVHLLKGSLQTFLNAMTYPDRTCYAVASQNEKDFYNLVNVYADAVYFPRAIEDPKVLEQEGWHYEVDEKGDLIYNGVVYNEMKGVYSSADSLLNRASQRSLFTDNTYAVDSGGDPAAIPDLSFDQFRDFHRKYYHPSNSRIFFAGDDDVYKRLDVMDEYLDNFEASDEYREKSAIPFQRKVLKETVRVVETYPAGADQPATHMFTMNWLLNDEPLTETEELTMALLDHLLLGTTSSVLRKTLMESGLGEAITGGGLSDELLQATFSIGMKGVKGDDVAKCEQLILDTINKVVADGFTSNEIEASMNTIEFSLREFNTGSFPKFLSFGLAANTKWLYDRSPTDALKFEAPLADLKLQIKTHGSKVFQNIMKKFIVDNTHRSIVELKPSRTMEQEQLDEERGRLQKIQEGLSVKDRNGIIFGVAELKRRQAQEDSPEARASIPSLQLNDLKRQATEYPIKVSENEMGTGITVVRHEMGSTSGIAYVALAVDLSKIPLEDVPLLPLFTQMMRETGAGDLDSVGLSQLIGTHTGGISVNLMTTAVHPEGSQEGVADKGENMITKFVIRGKATSEKIDKLFEIFKLVLTDAKLDSKSKVIELLREKRSRMESSIQSSGHSMVNSRMKAKYRVGGYVDEIMGGISYLDTVKALLKTAEEDWPSLLARFEKLRSTILGEDYCRSGMMLDITGDEAVLNSIQPSVESLLSSLPGKADGESLPDFYNEVHPWVPAAKKGMQELMGQGDEGFIVPTQVSYVGKSGLLYDEGEEIPGQAAVVARFLRTGYLWDRVRVMGGAYGGFCVFSPFSGLLSFLSYRDPNLEKTLDVYDAAAASLFEAADAMEKDPDLLETAIIGTIGDMDGALSPDQKGYTAFQRWLVNESPEYRQKYRKQVLSTKPSDFREFGERLKNLKNPSVAVVSSKGAFETAAGAGKVMKLNVVL